jgi:hypothetical protein
MPLGCLLPGIFSACLYFKVSFEVTLRYENKINMPSIKHHPVIEWSHEHPSFKTVLMTEQMDEMMLHISTSFTICNKWSYYAFNTWWIN